MMSHILEQKVDINMCWFSDVPLVQAFPLPVTSHRSLIQAIFP